MDLRSQSASVSDNDGLQVFCLADEACPEPVVLEFFLGIQATRCPDGIAAGAYELRNRGHQEYGEITCWPNRSKQFPLTTGADDGFNVRPVIRVRGMRLWSQEMAVYLTERKTSIGAMIEKLGLSKMLPRVGGFENALEPRPEDFGIDWNNYECIKCLGQFPRHRGIKPPEFCPRCNSGWWQHEDRKPGTGTYRRSK